jgi:alpha-1,3-glucosyltransferase
MWPLLRREGLTLQYTVLTALWSYSLSVHKLPSSLLGKLIHSSTYLAVLSLHAAELLVKGGVTERYKDIWVVANVTLSFASFCVMYLWIMLRMVGEVGHGPFSVDRSKPKVE